MELFKNLIYEYKKGMRDLSLQTCEKKDLEQYTELLDRLATSYLAVELGNNKVNLFFGKPECLDILKRFSDFELNKITPQEDFILGIMLGYSRDEQYNRILSKLRA